MKPADTPKGGGSDSVAYLCPVGHASQITTTIAPKDKDIGEKYGFYLCVKCAQKDLPYGKLYVVKVKEKSSFVPDLAALWWIELTVSRMARQILGKEDVGLPITKADLDILQCFKTISESACSQAEKYLNDNGYMVKVETRDNGDEVYGFNPFAKSRGGKTNIN